MVLFAIISSVVNYIRFSEKIELFIAKEQALAQTAQLRIILNELDNGILIAFQLPDYKFLSKFINNKINLLFDTGANNLLDSNEEHQQFFDS